MPACLRLAEGEIAILRQIRRGRAALQALGSLPAHRAVLALRARILSWAHRGLSAAAIARRTHASIPTVLKWCRRFMEAGLPGVMEPGSLRRARRATPETRRAMFHDLASSARLSTRKLAGRLKVSQSTVARAMRVRQGAAGSR